MPPAGTAELSGTGEQPHAASSLPDRAIEASWLIGLFAVPLVFSPLWLLIIYNDPKYFVLHLIAAVVVVAWAFEWAAGRREAGPWKPATPWGWAGRRPERWAVVSVVVFAAAAVISTLVSPAPRVSLWGRDNITLGYELYTFLALLVVFFAVALRLRTLDQVGRVFLVLMVAGGITALYGISQDFGWDPLSPRRGRRP
jgi:hypothetical protein